MKVTVAICTYNRAALLRQTLEGVTRQDAPGAQVEILVVDNNSRDDTAAVVASFGSAPIPPRRMVEARQGANFARNRAVSEARGDIIVFADDDILVDSTWLRELIAPFEQDGTRRIGAVAGEVVPVFPDGCPAWVAGFHGPQAFRSDAGPIEPPRVPMSANLAFRRDVLLQLGAFDTSLTREGGALFSADENVIMRKLRAAGYDAWFAPAAAVRHQLPGSRVTFRYVAKHAFGSGRSRVVDRATQPGATRYLLARFPANLLKAAGFGAAALLCSLGLQTDAAKKAAVRAWRSCGYLYQIPRSLCGKL
jgi:glucosyl-dolichyl phosphate glucuronosyltransferase